MKNDASEELRGRFRQTARLRLEEMDLLLDAIEGGIAKLESIEKLARHFHAMAGLGGTYGFPRISELGDEGELLIGSVSEGRGPTPDAVVRMRQLVRRIGEELR